MDNRTYVEIRYGPLMKFMEVYNYTNEEEAILDYIQKIGIQGFLNRKQMEEAEPMFWIYHELKPNTKLTYVDSHEYRNNIRKHISIKTGDPNWWVGADK